MNLEKFTERSRGFIQAAQTIAMRESHQRLAPGELGAGAGQPEQDGHQQRGERHAQERRGISQPAARQHPGRGPVAARQPPPHRHAAGNQRQQRCRQQHCSRRRRDVAIERAAGGRDAGASRPISSPFGCSASGGVSFLRVTVIFVGLL